MNNNANPKGGGVGNAVIGGFVYRGTALPSLQGKYLFGMFATVDNTLSGKVFSATMSASGSWTYSPLTLQGYPTDLGTYLKSFGQDQSGEVYLLTSDQAGPQGNTGKVYKIVAK
jgi:hypothetical protein